MLRSAWSRLPSEEAGKAGGGGKKEWTASIRKQLSRSAPRKAVRILVLGPSGSGKTTMVKQLQLYLARRAFEQARSLWRLLVYYNIILTIRGILEWIAPETSSTAAASGLAIADGDSDQPSGTYYDDYRSRLAPLLDLEERLKIAISEQGQGQLQARDAPTDTDSDCGSISSTTPLLPKLAAGKREICDEFHKWWDDPDDPGHTLARCAPAMKALWADPRVRARLAEKRVYFEDGGGFFLDDVDRITAPGYVPTNEDIFVAKFKTRGVVEHKFKSSHAPFVDVDWTLYEVGGREQQEAWASYCNDLDAIIFLAPVGAFDQCSEEVRKSRRLSTRAFSPAQADRFYDSQDPKKSRLEEAFNLWQTLVENKLLARVPIILILSKIDLLKKKLERGVQLREHMSSYRQPNDYEPVVQYLRNRFGKLHRKHSLAKSRELSVHLMTVLDPQVGDAIVNSGASSVEWRECPASVSHPSVRWMLIARAGL
ncbi:guanine nucleotide binding protein, alpha subunit [Earliella scabrosa]|nr:guanine nucleotide binding protein, alpha subunit [Earliella scabrosa]